MVLPEPGAGIPAPGSGNKHHATVLAFSPLPSSLSRPTEREPRYARMAAGSIPWRAHQRAYSTGEISDGLISLRPPQKTFV